MPEEKVTGARVSGVAAVVVICIVALVIAWVYLRQSQPPGFVSVPQTPRTIAETPAQLKENDVFLKKLAGLPVNKRARLLALNPSAGRQLAFSPDPAQKKALQNLIPLP